MSSKIEALRAQLAVLEAEEIFGVRKAAGEVTMEDKLALRALRQDYRENHRKGGPGTAQPPAIAVKAKVNS